MKKICLGLAIAMVLSCGVAIAKDYNVAGAVSSEKIWTDTTSASYIGDILATNSNTSTSTIEITRSYAGKDTSALAVIKIMVPASSTLHITFAEGMYRLIPKNCYPYITAPSGVSVSITRKDRNGWSEY